MSPIYQVCALYRDPCGFTCGNGFSFSTAGGTAQCVCPSTYTVIDGICTCPAPNVVTNGQCTAPTTPSGPSPSSGVLRRRRAETQAHKAIAICAKQGMQACGVFGGASDGEWECVDTARDLESCEPFPPLCINNRILILRQAVDVWSHWVHPSSR